MILGSGVPLNDPSEDKILVIDTVSQKRLNDIEKSRNKFKFKKDGSGVLGGTPKELPPETKF